MDNKSQSSSQNSSISQEEISRRESFNFNLYSSQECTSKYFGREAIEQEGYYCQFCDPQKKMKLCKYCYDDCHLKCREIYNNLVIKTEINENYKVPFGVKFFCDCGIIMKHKVKTLSNKDSIFCPMIFFDKLFCKEKSFYCEDENKNICSFCYFLCHKECKKNILKQNKNEINNKKCDCKCGNHTIYNEFIFHINLIQYQKLIQNKFWPIQLINLLFENKIFRNFEILFTDILINHNPKIIFSKEHPFPNLLESFTYFMNTQFKTYYFHPRIEKLFPFKDLITFMKNINYKTPEMCLVKFRLMFIVLFVHFKKDFKLIKALHPIDFITPTILERILIKKSNFTKSNYIGYIYEKYNFSNNDCGYIRSIILKDFLPFVINGLKKNIFNFINFQDELEMGLRVIGFALKRKLFNIEDLEILIKLINNFYECVLDSIPINEETEKIWLGLFSSLSDIFLMIGIDYNDQVVEEYFDKGKFNHNFIHVLSQHGQILFQMILKSHFAVVQHYQMISNEKKRKYKKVESQEIIRIQDQLKKKRINPNEIPYELPEKGILYNKTLKILHESLRLFSVTDNIYYFQIVNLNQKNIIYYTNQYTNIKDILNLNKDNFFLKLSHNLQKLLYNFFLYEDIHMTTQSISILFKTELSSFYNYINKNIKSYILKKDEKVDFNLKYIYKIHKNYIYMNSFLYNIENKFNYNKLVYEMCLGNLNKTLLDILVVFSKKQYCSYINFDLVEQIISILSLEITTEYGIRFFITGKNLSRIQKLLNRFSFKYFPFKNLNKKIDVKKDETLQIQNYILEFFRIFCKGLRIYNIDISGHNILKKLIKHLTNHLKEFLKFMDLILNKETGKKNYFSNSDIEFLKIQFKTHFKKIIQIFIYLSIYYKEHRFETIKNKIFEIFINKIHNFIVPELFFPYFLKDKEINNQKDEILTTKRLTTENYLISEEGRNLLTENTYRKNTETYINDDNNNRLEIDIIFCFFRLLSKCENFINIKALNDFLKPLNDFFDYQDDSNEKAIFKLFKSGKMSIKEKKILLKVMSGICFMEIISKEDFNYINYHITTKEYLKFYFDNNLNTYPSIIKENFENENNIINKESNNFLTIETKIQILERIKLLIQIFIYEIESFPFSLKNCNEYEIKTYSIELLHGIKRICDFFNFERELWNEPFILFYLLALKFLPKTEYFIFILTTENIDMKSIKNLKLKNDNEIIDIMTNNNFNIYDRDEIYKIMSSALYDIFKQTNINKDYSSETFFMNYDQFHEINFHPFCLIENKNYENFYDSLTIKKQYENNKIKTTYEESFININRTNYLVVFKNIVNNSKSNFRKIIIQYFKAYVNSKTKFDLLETFLCFITKTLFYDTENMQKTCLTILDDTFFVNFNNSLHQYIYHSFILSKNIYESKRFDSRIYCTKLILQFLQLLGEGFCTDFHDKIFLPLINLKDINKEYNEISIFENVINSLKQTIIFVYQTKKISVELPSDRLIVLMTNLIDFIIEYSVTLKEFSPILEEQIHKLLFVEPKMIDIMKLKPPEDSVERIKIVCLCKVKFFILLNTYLQNGKKYNTVKKLLEGNFSPIEIYNEILYNFRLLIQNSFKIIPERMKVLNSKKNTQSFVDECIHLYIHESKFRDSLELSVCSNLYILIKIFELKYSRKDVYSHFEKFEENNLSSNQINLEIDKDNNWSIDSIYAYIIYNFLEQIILFVEVRTDKEIDPTEEFLSKSDQLIVLQEQEDVEIIYYNQKNQLTFFLRPYLTFFLSNQTKNSFDNNIERNSATNKYMQLIYYSDFFLFEMIVNKNLNREKGILNFLSKIDYTVFEWINYLFIIAANLDLLIEKYRSPTLNDVDYNNPNNEIRYKYNFESLIISIVQICYITIVLIIWFRFKFFLYYECNILKKYNMSFVFRQKSDLGNFKPISKAITDFFSNSPLTVLELTKEMNKSIPLFQKIIIALFDTLLTNREICVLVYSGILIILYLLFDNSFFLIIEVIFIANLISTLFAIFSALLSKFKTMVTVLFVIYLLVYLFMWVAYFFIPEDFNFTVFNTKTKDYETENFCYSSFQCLLFITNYGVRNGGGVADQLPKDSFKVNPIRYLIRFFFDILFDIIIVLIMLNVFFGIMVDAFAELRNKNYEREKDQNSVCFICQLNSDECLRKNIDFVEHVQKIHNLWNYVYFLTYLHLSNSNNFNRVEGYVWEKLGNQDYSWLPLES